MSRDEPLPRTKSIESVVSGGDDHGMSATVPGSHLMQTNTALDPSGREKSGPCPSRASGERQRSLCLISSS